MNKIKNTLLFCLFLMMVKGHCADKKPNIIIIFADDLGYSDLGCFGSKVIRTPNIDKMANDGIKFTNFYAQSICGPSRTALMTGRQPNRVKQFNNKYSMHPVVDPSEIMIPELLKIAGYKTACVGKWDMARHSQTSFVKQCMPNNQGFDYYYGTPGSNDNRVRLFRNDSLVTNNADYQYLTQDYTNEAMKFIERNKENPFFVYLAHTMPHTKIDASPKFKGKSKRGLYGDVVEEIDWNVGRMYQQLETLGIADNTYVFFLSDNGPWYIERHPKLQQFKDMGGSHGGSSEPLRGHKTSTWEGGLRVPFLATGPTIPKHKISEEIGTTLDMLPTICQLAGIDPPSDRVLDGDDISCLLKGKNKKFKKDRYYYYFQAEYLQAIRKGNWKLHVPSNHKKPFEIYFKLEDIVSIDQPMLYDLKNDMGELTNVALEHPKIVKELLEAFQKMKHEIEAIQESR